MNGLDISIKYSASNYCENKKVLFGKSLFGNSLFGKPPNTWGADLYLSPETLDMMQARDRAPPGKDYRRLRNVVSSMVKRDKMRTNLEKLRKANNDPKVLWRLANSALGKPQS
jgi:hypothetical protein